MIVRRFENIHSYYLWVLFWLFRNQKLIRFIHDNLVNITRQHDTQHNDMQNNDSQHKGLNYDIQHNNTQHKHLVSLFWSHCADYSILYSYAKCCNAECRCAECRGAILQSFFSQFSHSQGQQGDQMIGKKFAQFFNK